MQTLQCRHWHRIVNSLYIHIFICSLNYLSVSLESNSISKHFNFFQSFTIQPKQTNANKRVSVSPGVQMQLNPFEVSSSAVKREEYEHGPGIREEIRRDVCVPFANLFWPIHLGNGSSGSVSLEKQLFPFKLRCILIPRKV